MTFGTDKGLTSDALPMRRKRDPGWITSTFEPRLPCDNFISMRTINRWSNLYLAGGCISSLVCYTLVLIGSARPAGIPRPKRLRL